MLQPTLQMLEIEKRFPGVRALQGVTLKVGAGEIVALVGENGAGKSTLMKILGGVYQPDGGQILIDNTPAAIHNVADSIRLGIGFIHQELNVLDNLDVAGNVYLGREPVYGGFLRLIDRGKMRDETKKCLLRLGLDIRPETTLSELSLAQQQLVEIAKALSLNARILIMDEPTSSLTLTETARLLEVVKELSSQGVSIIYISHRLSEIEAIADRVVVLRDGANAGELSRSEISHERIVKMMVGRNLEDFYQHPAAEAKPRYFTIDNIRTRRFPQRHVSFEIGKGEILGLAGLVGAGRSELAQAIFGVENAVDGCVTLNGQPLKIRTARDAIKHGIYLVPEDRRRAGLITEEAIRKNVTLPALERYSSRGIIKNGLEQEAVGKICQKLNVKASSIEETVGNLSGGNQQKVVLAKWLALAPNLLIFDEPTRGIDIGAKSEIYALMRNLALSGVAILMISSDMEEVLGVSDRVAVMHEGALTGILERNECSEENIMRLAIGNHGIGS